MTPPHPRNSAGEKLCVRCNQYKPEDQFGRRASAFDGLHHWCKECTNSHHKQRYNKEGDTWKKRNPIKHKEVVRDQALKHKYGMTLKEYRELERLQQGKCAICLQPKRLVVDHDHSSGEVRGLLCIHCNGMVLPVLEANDDRLFGALAYLGDKHVRRVHELVEDIPGLL